MLHAHMRDGAARIEGRQDREEGREEGRGRQSGAAGGRRAEPAPRYALGGLGMIEHRRAFKLIWLSCRAGTQLGHATHTSHECHDWLVATVASAADQRGRRGRR